MMQGNEKMFLTLDTVSSLGGHSQVQIINEVVDGNLVKLADRGAANVVVCIIVRLDERELSETVLAATQLLLTRPFTNEIVAREGYNMKKITKYVVYII